MKILRNEKGRVKSVNGKQVDLYLLRYWLDVEYPNGFNRQELTDEKVETIVTKHPGVLK